MRSSIVVVLMFVVACCCGCGSREQEPQQIKGRFFDERVKSKETKPEGVKDAK